MANARILIADNSKDFVWLLVEYLSKYPEIEIIGVAYDGRQTIEMIEQTKPDMVLLDLIMPDTDGLEVIKNIYEKHSSLEVIVISAIRNVDLIKMVMDLGVEQYFIKPVNLYSIASYILKKANPEG